MSWPAVISAVYCVHCVKGVAWVRVSTVFAGSHDCARVRPPEIVYVTVGLFIASLNVTTTSAFAAMFCVAFAGFVVTMNGFTAAVVNVQGFGTGPGTSGFPRGSLPAVICAVYGVDSANRVVWLRVSVVFPGAHVYVRGTTGLIDQLTVAMFIAWLNVTTMSAFRATPVAPFAGTVEAMYGFAHTVVKDHGFGTGPATSGSPTLSLPAVICAV